MDAVIVIDVVIPPLLTIVYTYCIVYLFAVRTLTHTYQVTAVAGRAGTALTTHAFRAPDRASFFLWVSRHHSQSYTNPISYPQLIITVLYPQL